ncbi:MAG: ScyD/ScyE family protein [Candidatus Methanoperedens sp.]|nr:ScyD/ScyE family protein [Candidatus Methanoperedens sp.]
MSQISKAILIALILMSSISIATPETGASHRANITASGLNKPYGLFLEKNGDLLIADSGSATPYQPSTSDGKILKLTSKGSLEVLLSDMPSRWFIGNTEGPMSIARDDFSDNNESLFVDIGIAYKQETGSLFETYDARGFSVLIYDIKDQTLIKKYANLLDAEAIFNPDKRPPLESNPTKIKFGKDRVLYVVDSAANAVWQVDKYGQVTTFAALPLYDLPPGAPPIGEKIEPVPTSIAIKGSKAYISVFTGFPFIAGLGRVIEVDIDTGEQKDFITQLNFPVDIEFDRDGNLYILEYTSSFDLTTGFQLNSGRILKSGQGGSHEIIVDGINFPRDMVIDRDGMIYVSSLEQDSQETETGRGQILKIMK